MIFPVLEIEDVVQVNDQTRLSAVKSFKSKDEAAITAVEIEPEAGAGFKAVTGTSFKDWFLDWAYTGVTRTVTVTVRITTNGAPVTLAKTISIVTVADDKLFSKDTDLTALEPDILKYVPEGRSSFLNVHRQAQRKILEALDESGLVDNAGAKLTKAAVVDVSEVSAWSRDLTLMLIYKGLINSVDDAHVQKMNFYASEMNNRKARAILRLDLSGNGQLEQSEGASLTSMELVRR